MTRHKRQLQQLTIDGAPEVVAELDLSPKWGGKRPGAGRRKGVTQTVTISIRLTLAERKMLQSRAEHSGQTLSQYVVQLIRDCELSF